MEEILQKNKINPKTKIETNKTKIYTLMKLILILLLLLGTASCMELPENVVMSLDLAGNNKRQLKKVLRHYQRHEEDSLKFKAACFLIENMRWHYSTAQITEFDPQLEVFRLKVDSIYYSMVKGKANAEFVTPQFSKDFNKAGKTLRDSITRYQFLPPKMNEETVSDLKTLDYKFLCGHIDNAFRTWKNSPYARHLNFNDFCEYILPYRSVSGHPDCIPGDSLYSIFGKYTDNGIAASLQDYVQRYNHIVSAMRGLLRRPKIQESLGIYDLFFYGRHDCVDIATYGCNVLRSCGVPVMIEYNIAYKELAGRHFHCSVPDSAGGWQTFNSESGLPGYKSHNFNRTLNIYRQYFSAQQDAPFFLKRKDEYLPPLFTNPCIKDVTAHTRKMISITLPFPDTTQNRLAYLAIYQISEQGLAPVTWGVIDTTHQNVTFDNAIRDVLYFPIYYENKELKSFSEPFFLATDSTSASGYRFVSLPIDSCKDKGTLILTRKYPRKPSMIKIAEELVGSRFIASDKPDLSNAKTLYTITKPPIPYLQEYKLNNRKAYRFYRFTAPDEHPHAHVSMLEYVTEKSYGYQNSMPPTPLPIFYPGDTLHLKDNSHLIKIRNVATWEQMNKKTEHDGNMQTAPSAYKTVNLRLQVPRVLTRIRFAPRNADNGITPGKRYELLYWDRGWHSAGHQMAEHEYISFDDVPLRKLYRLHCLDGGKEELPFIVENGQQLFIYHNILK